MTNRTGFRFLALTFLIVAASCMQQTSSDEKVVVRRDKADIDYRDTGEGGATLLFVHGLGIDQTYWNSQVEYFSQDYRVVTFDLPGHGKSGRERPHWSVRGYAGDVYTLIKRLNLKNVILIGHSLGGDINLMAATYRPKNIIGFIGIDNFKNAGMPVPKKMQKEVDAFLKNLKTDYQGTIGNFVAQALASEATPPEITSRVKNNFMNAHRPAVLSLMPSVFELYKEEQRLLPELKVKMHLINVANSPTNTKALDRLIPGRYDLQTIRGTSHYPMLENPNELNILLRQAIEEISRENDQAKKPL